VSLFPNWPTAPAVAISPPHPAPPLVLQKDPLHAKSSLNRHPEIKGALITRPLFLNRMRSTTILSRDCVFIRMKRGVCSKSSFPPIIPRAFVYLTYAPLVGFFFAVVPKTGFPFFVIPPSDTCPFSQMNYDPYTLYYQGLSLKARAVFP